jgi:DNA-binding FadR family transcriptional regulator
VVLESAVVSELAASAGASPTATATAVSATAAASASASDSAAARAAAAGHAAAGHPGLAEARELLDAMEHPADGPLAREEFLTLDQSFHLALAAASGNAVIAAMLSGLRDSIESYIRVGAAALPDWAATASRLTLEHRAIVAAIDEGDAEGARTRIRNHIETYHAETAVSSIHPR